MENLSNDQIGNTKEPLLDTLHEQLKKMEADSYSNVEKIEFIKHRIRKLIPTVDTGKALPYKKTPSGKIKVLHMSYTRSRTNEPIQAEIDYLKFFAKTVLELGLKLEILTNRNSREDIEQELRQDEYKQLEYSVTESQLPVWKWTEDTVEYLQNGRVAILNQFDEELLQWAMTEGRRNRWRGKIDQENLEEALKEDHLWIPLGVRVNGIKMGLEGGYTSPIQEQNIAHLRVYLEGGNMITGEDRTGKTVILIGKDAIAATAHIYQINDEDVKKLICEDFGLENIEQVICVEQPGQFHLDMGMLFIGNGVVIVNDSEESLKDAREMAEIAPCLTTEKMAARLKLQYELEEEAIKDLEAAGIEVRRKKLENNMFYNFFNGEFVEGKDGFNYYITNGGPAEQQERFESLMVKQWKVVKKVIFSPQEIAHKSLQEKGGVGCRIKGTQQ